MIARFDRSDADRGPRKDQVSDAQGEKLRKVGDDPVHGEDHLRRIAALSDLVIERHFEVEVLYVSAQLCQRNELGGEGGRVVEGLADLPWQSFGDAPALEVAGREIDSESHFTVTAGGELFVEEFGHAVDADDQLRFVVQIFAERGNVKRLVVTQQGRIGFQKEDGRFGNMTIVV